LNDFGEMQDAAVAVRKWLDLDLDDWTRHVVRRHFDPRFGSPYWLRVTAGLSFDPRDITRYTELAAFGPFPIGVLRDLDPADLVPQTEGRPLAGRIYESGGTTGDPCRVFYTRKMIEHRALWRRWSFDADGLLPGRAWVQATPTGPHIIGNGTFELTDFFGSRVYLIDMDPRWVKRLIRDGRLAEVEEYTAHVIEQVAHIIRSQPIDYLNTTPALFQALTRTVPEDAASLSGVRLSGTQITPQMYRSFVKLLGDGVCGLSYGNTFGIAAGLPAEDDGNVMPYVPNYPQVTMAVVNKDDWTQPVDYAGFGRVRLTVLHEDLFLPNILERDQALRYETGPDWPCDGVANVRPLQISRASPEGIY
jgi:hypothetical protein